MTTKTMTEFSPKVCEREVRMLGEHVGEYPTRWAAVKSIAAKIGYSAQALHDWTRKAGACGGTRGGVPTEVAEQLRALERDDQS